MKSRIWMVLVLLVLASLACSLGGAGSTPEAGEVAIPEEGGEAAVPEEEGAAADEEAPALELDSDAMSGFDSYRMRTVTQWTPESGNPERMVMEQEYTRDPEAHRMVMESEQGGIEWVQIEDTAWYCFGGSCAQSQQGAEDVASDLGGFSFDPEEFTSADSEYVGQDTVNDIRTRHYSLDLNVVEVMLLAQGEIANVQGDAWVADEPSLPAFVVRYVLSWEETRGEQGGAFEFSYDVYDVNEPITIEPPEGAAGLPEDVPAYPGATDLIVMEGLASFSAPDDAATVANFYRTELAAQGWAKDSDDDLGGMVTQVWSKDGRTLNLMISSGEGGDSSVVITME